MNLLSRLLSPSCPSQDNQILTAMVPMTDSNGQVEKSFGSPHPKHSWGRAHLQNFPILTMAFCQEGAALNSQSECVEMMSAENDNI